MSSPPFRIFKTLSAPAKRWSWRSAHLDLFYFVALMPWVVFAWWFVVDHGSPQRGVITAACYTVAVLAVPLRRRRVTLSALITFGAFAIMVVTHVTTTLGVFPLLICAPMSVAAVTQWHPRRWPGILAALVAAVGSIWSPAVIISTEKRWMYAFHIAILALCYLWASRRRLEEESKRREIKAAVLRAQDAERERIADELHDGLGHALTAIRAKSATATAGPLDQERMAEALQLVAHLSAESLNDLRRTLRLLSRVESGEAKEPALRHLLADLTRINPNLTVASDPQTLDRIESSLAPPARAVLRHIVEESVINVIQHNGAQCPMTMKLDIIRRPQHVEMVRIEVVNPIRRTDNLGDNRGSGRGLPLLRQRVVDVGGVIAVNAGRDYFTIKAMIPVCEPARQSQ